MASPDDDPDARVWTLLADGLLAGTGPWRDGELICFSQPGVPWVRTLALRGAYAATRTLCVRGLPVTLAAGAEVLWNFSDSVSGLRASFAGDVQPPSDPYGGTWEIRVRAVTISQFAGAGRRSRHIDYRQLPPAFDPMNTFA